jgi:hypothetical protein
MACEDGGGLEFVCIGKVGEMGPQMQSHKNSRLSSHGTAT